MTNVEWDSSWRLGHSTFNIEHLTFRSLLWQQLLHHIDHVPNRLDRPRLVIRNRDMKVLFDGEEDGERVERVDAGVGQRGVLRQLVVGHLLLFAHDLDELLRDLIACHGAAMIPNGVRRPLSKVEGWLLYPAWILLCAALVFALRNSEDPSRRQGRILSNDAGVRAVNLLRQVDRARYRDYEAVHVAWEENRW